MTLDELLCAIERDVCELPDRTSPEDWPEAMLVTGDELRHIITARLMEPFVGNDDAWDQGYDVGRATGEANAEKKIRAELTGRFEAVETLGAQFRTAAPFTVRYMANHDYPARILSRDGNTIAWCEYESDAQAIVDLLNTACSNADVAA